ncbi:MAG TPA: GNAT family N-acetyltransferase [Pirellulales bacterium]
MPEAVLLITSDLACLSSVSGAARRTGCELRTAMNISAIDDKLAEAPPGLIVIDLSTAGLNVTELVHRLRARLAAGVRIVGFGSHVHKSLLAAAEEAGCDLVVSRGEFHARMDDFLRPPVRVAPEPDKSGELRRRSITVRDASREDAATLVDFNIRLAHESENKRLDRETVVRGVGLALAKPELCRYFVADIGNQVVGQTMVTFEWSDWRAGVFWWIQSVYVVPEHRRAGVFRSLFMHVHQLAQSDPDACGLRLYVEKQNAVAQDVYQRLGMSPSGHWLLELDWSNSLKNSI